MARHRLFFRNLFALACFAVILGIYIRFATASWWGYILYLVAAGLVLERTLLWRLRAAAAFAAAPALAEPVELKIEESNLLHRSAAGSTEIRWANILACHETKNLFVLQLSEDDTLTIPKRAFQPGDLFRFQELRKKELLVPTTRDNPDVVLLKFAAGWGLVAMGVLALFIGDVDTFLTRFPRSRQRLNYSVPKNEGTDAAVAASPAELSGRGPVYLIPVGTIKSVSVPDLLQEVHKHCGVQLRLLPAMPPPPWAENKVRKQFVAEDLLTAMKLAYPKLAADPSAVLIALTDQDIYISHFRWSYTLALRDEERFAVISTSHLSDRDEDDKPVTAEVPQERAAKLLLREVGVLHYRLQPSSDYRSVLYQYVGEASDLDDLSEDYLATDAQVRADLHVQKGDPCFILRHYTEPERQHQEMASVTSCGGYYREPDLETVQINLRSGLLLDQRTDFLISDKVPLELTRLLRTQDSRSRAFGIGGTHNLNIFLSGDRWPFTWMDLVLESGTHSHFRRSNWGFGCWDANYTNRDVNTGEFSASTIDWAWPGWKLRRGGYTYRFPDWKGALRPEQEALSAIQSYDGSRLALSRDSSGDLLLARSPSGNELRFAYDSGHRIIRAQAQSGAHFEYSYNAAGHLARVTDSDRRVTEYDYDVADRMNSIVEGGTRLCTLTYDSGGRVESEVLSDGRTYKFNYSLGRNGEIFGVAISDSAGPPRMVQLSTADYTLDVWPRGEQ